MSPLSFYLFDLLILSVFGSCAPSSSSFFQFFQSLLSTFVLSTCYLVFSMTLLPLTFSFSLSSIHAVFCFRCLSNSSGVLFLLFWLPLSFYLFDSLILSLFGFCCRSSSSFRQFSQSFLFAFVLSLSLLPCIISVFANVLSLSFIYSLCLLFPLSF